MARYSKQTWDTTSIFNPTRMNHIEQGIYDADLREGGTITGQLAVEGNFFCNNKNGSTTSLGESVLASGNNVPQGTAGNSRGRLRLFCNNSYYTDLTAPNDMSGNRQIWLPQVTNNSQVLALRSDDDWTSVAQGVTSCNISQTSYKEYLVIVLVTSTSPNLCYTFHLYRSLNLLSGTLKYIMGSWANQSYGTAIEVTANTSSIDIASAYVNGSNVLSNTKLYVSGRH